MSARASRIRTGDLGEFTYTIAASDQAGGGVRYVVTPSIQVIADGAVVSYRRAVPPLRSATAPASSASTGCTAAGGSRSTRRGSRLAIRRRSTSTLPDRSGAVRGWRTRPGQARARVRRVGSVPCRISIRARRWPPAITSRAAMARGSSAASAPRSADARRSRSAWNLAIGSRSTCQAGRTSKATPACWSADWQTALNRMNGFVRFAQRSNVTSASRVGLLHAARCRRPDVLPDVDSQRRCSASLTTTRTDRPGGRWQHLLAGRWRRAAAGRATGPVAEDRRHDQPQRRPADAVVRAA